MRDSSFPTASMGLGKGCLAEAVCLAVGMRLAACDAEESDVNKPSEKRVLVGIAQPV